MLLVDCWLSKLLDIKGFDLTWLQVINEPLYTRELLKCKIRKKEECVEGNMVFIFWWLWYCEYLSFLFES